MGCLRGGADLVAPTWTAAVGRLKMLFLLSLGWYIWAIHETGCCGAQFSLLWQWEIASGHWERTCFYPSGLGHRERGKAQSKCSPSNLPALRCDQCDDKGTGLERPNPCSCFVQDLRVPSLMWRPRWFSPILVILTPITSFSCYLLLPLASQTSSLESPWCCSKTQYCRGPLWLHFIFRWPARLSCFLSSCSRLSHVDLAIEDPLMEKWEKGVLKQ